MPRGNRNNIIPNSERTPEERKKIARAGGIKSGKVRREKRLMSQIFAELLTNGLDQDIEKASTKIIRKGGGPAVSLMKTIAETTEGSKHTLGVDSDKPFDMTINIIGVPSKTE